MISPGLMPDVPNRVQSGCTEGPSDRELERAIVFAVTGRALDVVLSGKPSLRVGPPADDRS
jgi:hypothetical protein